MGAALSGSGFVTLVVSAKGSGMLRYVWQKDGKPILGAASATYLAREVGDYSVVVIDGKASSTSSVAVAAGMAQPPRSSGALRF